MLPVKKFSNELLYIQWDFFKLRSSQEVPLIRSALLHLNLVDNMYHAGR